MRKKPRLNKFWMRHELNIPTSFHRWDLDLYYIKQVKNKKYKYHKNCISIDGCKKCSGLFKKNKTRRLFK